MDDEVFFLLEMVWYLILGGQGWKPLLQQISQSSHKVHMKMSVTVSS